MEKTAKKSHPLRTFLLILLSLVVLVAALPFIYSLAAGFTDYDDIASLAASAGVRALSVDSNGVVSFSADKAAVYSYALRSQADREIAGYISQLPFCSENTVKISKFGYTLGSDCAGASVKLRLFGIIPVQLHAEADYRLSPDELMIKLRELKIGRWISVPVEEFSAAIGLPELTEGLRLDISDVFGELCPLELRAKDDVLSFRCDILNKTVENVGDQAVVLANMAKLMCCEESDAAKVLRGNTDEVYGGVRDSAALSELLTGILKFGHEATAAALKPALEDSPFLGLELGDVAVCRSGYSDRISENLSVYETALTAMRDEYKQLNYHIAKDGLRSPDGAPAESALPEEWEARVILQYNREFESIVKANDGSLSPVMGWVVLPNPPITDLQRDWDAALPGVPGITVYDLTVACRLPDGSPATVFLTALDELGVNVISPELFDEISAYEGLPVYCASDIISPNNFRFVPTGILQRPVMLYVP